LNPKKSKELIKPTSEELGLPEALVKDAVDFYWENMRKSLSELKKSKITVAGVGIFSINPKKLVGLKEKYKTIAERMNTDTFNKFSAKKEIERKLSNIETIFDEINENVKKKQEIKQKRKDDESRNQTSLEE
jgi:nucleoid DNA-binding protein